MKPHHNLFLGSFIVAFSMAQAAQAGSLEWKGSTSGLTGGTDLIWDTNTTANWWNGTADVVWPALGGTDDDAIFGGTAGTVTITTATANDITFNTTGYTLSGGVLTLNGTTPTITNGTGIDAIISSKISGSAGLTKAGDGILTLSGANDYTGITTISAGILKAGSGAALGSNVQGTTVSSGATLDIGGQNLGTEIVTISGTGVGGNGAIINTGGEQINALGRIVLAGDATIGGTGRWDLRNSTPTLNLAGFTLTKTGANYIALVAAGVTPGAGNIVINQGELNLSTSTNLNGSAANSITVNSGGTLGMYQSSSAHAWTLNLNNGSTLRGENGTTAQNNWAGTVNVAGTANLLAESGHNLTISGGITSTGNINKTGAGTVILTGSNNYSGTTTVSVGTLSATKAAALSGYSSASKISVSSTGTLAINYGGASDWISGELDSLLANNSSGFAAGSTLLINTVNGAGIYASNIGVTNLGLRKIGANTLTLSGNNAYTGTTLISVGNLQINSASAIGGTQIITSGVDNAALVLNDGLTAGSGKTITIAGGGAGGFYGALSTTGTATWEGDVIIGATTGTRVGTLGTSGALTISGDISEPLSTPSELIIRTNGATVPVILTGNNSYTGGTRLVIGTLRLGSANALGTGAGNLTITGSTTLSSDSTTARNIANNVVLAGNPIFGHATYNGKLTFNGLMDLGGATRTMTTDSVVEIANTISTTGAFGITKVGAADLILSAANSYTGPTTINAGTLVVAHKDALATSSSVFISTTSGGGTLRLATDLSASIAKIETSSSNPGKIISDRATPGAGINHNMGAGLFGANTYTFEAGSNVNSGTAGITFTSANLSAGSSSVAVLNPTTAVVTINGAVNIGSSNYAKTLRLDGSSSGNLISGIVSNGLNTLSVTKTGTSTWELSNVNTYTGTTTVSDGKLILSGNRVAETKAIDVGNVAGQTGTLDIRGDLPMAGNVLSVGLTAAGASGIVNHSAGLVSFTGGNAVLIGRSTGNVSGTYNLSGGELKTYASGERGVMLGVNDGTAGNLINATFNLSGSGVLNNATGNLEVVRGSGAASYQNSTYNQTGGSSTNGYLVIGGGLKGNGTGANVAYGANSIANFSVTGGVFSTGAFAGLSYANNVVSTMTIGGTADVTLPAFPTTRGTGSTATLYFDGGTLKPLADSTTYISGLTAAYIQDGGAKIDTNGKTITISQNLLEDSGSTGGGFTKTGTGTLTLSGNNTYAGTLNLNNGTLNLGHANAFGTGQFNINTNTVFWNNNTGSLVNLQNSSYNWSSHFVFGGTGDVDTGAGNVTLVGSRIANIATSRTLTISGSIIASGTQIRKDGSGTMVFAGNNSYTGETLVNQGVLNVRHANALGTSAGVTTVNDGATLQLEGGVNFATETLGLTGQGIGNLGALRNISGNNTWNGAINAGVAVVSRIGADAGSLTLAGTVTLSTTASDQLVFQGDGNINVTGQITGASRITSSALGSGIRTLSHASNNYAGDTGVNGGFLQAGVTNALPYGVGKGNLVLNGGSSAVGVFNLNGYDVATNGLSGTTGTFVGRVVNNANGTTKTLTVGNGDATASYAGVLADNNNSGTGILALEKTGSGTQTLTGTNTYTGTTSVTGGTLVINGDNSDATGAVVVSNADTRLAGSGTIGGNTTINDTAIHSPGNSPGVQKFTGGLTYSDGSIFEWDIDRTQSQTRGTGYDGVNVTNTLTGLDGADAGTDFDAKFRIVITDGDFSDTFWDTNKTWSDIFTAADGTTAKSNWADIFGGGFQYYYNNGSTLTSIATPDAGTVGYFTLSGSALTWTAVPEPTSALVGLLITAGLLRRRRVA